MCTLVWATHQNLAKTASVSKNPTTINQISTNIDQIPANIGAEVYLVDGGISVLEVSEAGSAKTVSAIDVRIDDLLAIGKRN